MDVQGDMGTPNETVYRLTRRNNTLGFNYFSFSKDLENGGPISNANLIIELYKNSVMDKGIGPVQKSVFKQLIVDCYRSKGILDEDESTWDNELPTPKYFEYFVENILGSTVTSKLTVLSEMITNLSTLKIEKERCSEDEKEAYEKEIYEELEKLKNFTTQFQEYIISDEHKEYFNQFKIEKEYIDISYYSLQNNYKVLATLYTYIKALAECPLFGENPFPQIDGVVRFDISGYTTIGKPEEAIFFINYVLYMYFRMIKERGEYRFMPEEYKAIHGKFCDFFCFIDESKLILPTGRDKENPYNIINRIITEARKYGGGMGIISQRIEHFSAELINSIYTKVILTCEKSDAEKAIKSLGIKTQNNYPPYSLFEEQGKVQDGLAIIGTTAGLYENVVTPWYVK